MAYAFIGSGKAVGASVSATFAAGETVLVALEITNGDPTTRGSVSDGTNTYTATNAAPVGSGGTWLQLFKADNVTAGSYTVSGSLSPSGGGGVTSIGFWRYTGLVAGAPDQHADNFIDGTYPSPTFTSSSMTPSAQPALLFSVNVDQNTNISTPGSGFTSRDTGVSSFKQLTAEEMRLTSTAAVTADWTVGNQFDTEVSCSVILLEAVSDLTLAMTGNAATAAVGTLGPTVAHALTGSAATGAAGTVAPAVSRAITGNVATGSLGQLVAAFFPGLTGTQTVCAVGSFSGVLVNRSLIGAGATGLAGNVAVEGAPVNVIHQYWYPQIARRRGRR